jgi:aminoglycoside phosphotransferase (APT) family kinase protein
MENNFQKNIILKVGEYLNAEIIDMSTPPQGMDSQVFFIKSAEGREYAVKCYGRKSSGDIAALKLLKENKIDISIPEVFGIFEFEGRQVAIMEKINFPLLESVPVSDMGRYISSMVRNLRKIHEIKSDKAGSLADIDGGLSWKEVLLAKFTGADPKLDWNKIAFRSRIDSGLVLDAVEKIICKIKDMDFICQPYSFLHTDFNQRNLFVDPQSDQIAAIIDWEEAMFGDPIYDFTRIRMYIWHFNLSKNILEKYHTLLSLSQEQKKLEDLYWLSRIIEYLAYYSEDLNDFNVGRIKLHQNFLRGYKWNA